MTEIEDQSEPTFNSELAFARLQHARELVQKLTFFVVGSELIFCGYVLLTAKELGAARNLEWLFLLAGLAAFFGIVWRVFYNEEVHAKATGKHISGALKCMGSGAYILYVVLSILFYSSFLISGFLYLQSM